MWDSFIKLPLFKIAVRAKQVTDILYRIYEINSVNIEKSGSSKARERRKLFGKFRK
jgi:hypothetical protein